MSTQAAPPGQGGDAGTDDLHLRCEGSGSWVLVPALVKQQSGLLSDFVDAGSSHMSVSLTETQLQQYIEDVNTAHAPGLQLTADELVSRLQVRPCVPVLSDCRWHVRWVCIPSPCAHSALNRDHCMRCSRGDCRCDSHEPAASSCTLLGNKRVARVQAAHYLRDDSMSSKYYCALATRLLSGQGVRMVQGAISQLPLDICDDMVACWRRHLTWSLLQRVIFRMLHGSLLCCMLSDDTGQPALQQHAGPAQAARTLKGLHIGGAMTPGQLQYPAASQTEVSAAAALALAGMPHLPARHIGIGSLIVSSRWLAHGTALGMLRVAAECFGAHLHSVKLAGTSFAGLERLDSGSTLCSCLQLLDALSHMQQLQKAMIATGLTVALHSAQCLQRLSECLATEQLISLEAGPMLHDAAAMHALLAAKALQELCLHQKGISVNLNAVSHLLQAPQLTSLTLTGVVIPVTFAPGSSAGQRMQQANASMRAIAEIICACTRLKQLNLQMTLASGHVVDAAAFNFAAMQKLTCLQLAHVQTDSAVPEQIGDGAQRGIASLAHLPALKVLVLAATNSDEQRFCMDKTIARGLLVAVPHLNLTTLQLDGFQWRDHDNVWRSGWLCRSIMPALHQQSLRTLRLLLITGDRVLPEHCTPAHRPQLCHTLQSAYIAVQSYDEHQGGSDNGSDSGDDGAPDAAAPAEPAQAGQAGQMDDDASASSDSDSDSDEGDEDAGDPNWVDSSEVDSSSDNDVEIVHPGAVALDGGAPAGLDAPLGAAAGAAAGAGGPAQPADQAQAPAQAQAAQAMAPPAPAPAPAPAPDAAAIAQQHGPFHIEAPEEVCKLNFAGFEVPQPLQAAAAAGMPPQQGVAAAAQQLAHRLGGLDGIVSNFDQLALLTDLTLESCVDDSKLLHLPENCLQNCPKLQKLTLGALIVRCGLEILPLQHLQLDECIVAKAALAQTDCSSLATFSFRQKAARQPTAGEADVLWLLEQFAAYHLDDHMVPEHDEHVAGCIVQASSVLLRGKHLPKQFSQVQRAIDILRHSAHMTQLGVVLPPYVEDTAAATQACAAAVGNVVHEGSFARVNLAQHAAHMFNVEQCQLRSAKRLHALSLAD